MARALILAPFADGPLAELRRSIDITYESWLQTRRLWDPQELGARLHDEDTTVLVVESDFVFEEIFEQAEALKFVGICRGTANNVDLEAATRQGVLVVNTPGRNAQAVAEHVLGLMLALARRIPWAHSYVAGGRWENPTEPYVSMRGIELAGRTLGIIGLGAIGRRVAEMARAMGMGLLGHDPYVSNAPEGVELASLDDILSRSHFVTIHVPLTPKTGAMIDARRLALMQSTAYLVNVSEAAIVCESALVQALRVGHIAGAAIDVFESHPVEPSSPLLSLDNVVLTPHLGGATQETIQRHSRTMATDIQRYLAGRRPMNLINPDAWEQRG